MNAKMTGNGLEADGQYLTEAISRVRAALERHVARASGQEEAAAKVGDLPPVQTGAAERRSTPLALEALCGIFALSPFEREILLICAGMELDPIFAALCAAAHGDPRKTSPTFGLALSAFPTAHWSALGPDAPLRYWRLLDVGSGDSLTTSPLRIDERVLNYLLGVSSLDERLRGFVSTVPPGGLCPSHRAVADRVRELWSLPEKGSRWVVQLCGHDPVASRAIAASAAAALGLTLQRLRAVDIPSAVAEREGLARLLDRETILSGCALLIDLEGDDAPEGLRSVPPFVERLRTFAVVASRDPLRFQTRPAVRLDVPQIGTAEQCEIWEKALGPLAAELNGEVATTVSHFNMNLQAIQAASAEVRRGPSIKGDAGHSLLWETCRVQARVRMDRLAQRIESTATWDDLVLPQPQTGILREIAAHVRQRVKVYETWGFAAKSSRGLGISALFSGPSGTGKTLASEVLANTLKLDLYRIDLSQVVSKYIGETEKHLRRLFDAAEESGAILLFDEADALFGKRSEVKDSHDRYANIEVSYLLQRMEAYRGLAILTTNMKSALDTAFLRRIRFVVQFPFPDKTQRAEIWRHIFPAATPTDPLPIEKLARLNVAGGNIRNIALNAAFLAADAGDRVGMVHLLRAAQSEYAKLERPLTEVEVTVGWNERKYK